MPDSTYDFIVIGSGAGGGPVAANLARAGHTVLVLEAGEDCCNFNYQVPCFHTIASEDPDMSWDFFVRHYKDEATQKLDSKFVAEKDGILYPRAGTLGGCTAHNAMITVYPHNSDWEGIRELTGDDSWSADHMRTYFERLEACSYESSLERFKEAIYGIIHHQGLNPARHGFSGWLHTEVAPATLALKDTELLKIVIGAALDNLSPHLSELPLDLATLFDPNDWRMVTSKHREGVCMVPLATHKGCRNGTRERLLDTAKDTGGKLKIQTGALVTRILFDENMRATGVEYMLGAKLYRASRNPQDSLAPPRQQAYCNHEVIVSGGAFNSPQLLMLSGIGDKQQLDKFGIKTLVHLPGVGKNMQDRYEVGIVSELDKPFALLDGATFLPPGDDGSCDPVFTEWKHGKGVYATNGAAVAVTKRSSPDKADPDLFIFGLPAFFKGYYPGYSKTLGHYQNIFTWAVLKAHTNNNAGEVSIKSADPRDTPEIVFHYFGEGNDSRGEDLKAVVEGVKFVRKMNERVRDQIGLEEQLPGTNVMSDEEIATFVRNEAWGHHASCTNKIGTDDDPMAVLDSRFRVRGTKGLRVVDASVFPRIPGFFIVSAVYMIAEKASDVILEDLKAAKA